MIHYRKRIEWFYTKSILELDAFPMLFFYLVLGIFYISGRGKIPFLPPAHLYRLDGGRDEGPQIYPA